MNNVLHLKLIRWQNTAQQFLKCHGEPKVLFYLLKSNPTDFLFGLFDCQPWFNACQHPYQTLWGRAPSPEILPCWWPCKCRCPRRPVGCCWWLTCCDHLPACWKCTALTTPAAAPSCTNQKTGAHITYERREENMATKSHLTATPAKFTRQHTFDVTRVKSSHYQLIP